MPAITPVTATHSAAPRASRAAAVLFAPIHKAIRLGLAEMLVRIGQTAFGDDAAVGALFDEIESLFHKLERHAEVEDTVVAPALEGRAGEVFATHACLDRLTAELRALMVRARTSRPDEREVIGRTLYLHFSRFVAEQLSHMAEEEQVLQPLLEWMHSDEELFALHGAVLARLSPEEKLASAPFMVWAAAPNERIALVRGFAAAAGPAVAAEVVKRAGTRLSPAELKELLELAVR